MARARDVSARGLGLVLRQEVQPGTLVSVQLLTAAGLHAPRWHRLDTVIIQAVTATK